MSFADNITIVSVEKTVKKIQKKTNIVNRNVGAWLDDTSLTLAAHRTEAILISGRNIVEKMEVTVGDIRIESNRAIKYLEVIIDDRLNIQERVICNPRSTSIQMSYIGWTYSMTTYVSKEYSGIKTNLIGSKHNQTNRKQFYAIAAKRCMFLIFKSYCITMLIPITHSIFYRISYGRDLSCCNYSGEWDVVLH